MTGVADPAALRSTATRRRSAPPTRWPSSSSIDVGLQRGQLPGPGRRRDLRPQGSGQGPRPRRSATTVDADVPERRQRSTLPVAGIYGDDYARRQLADLAQHDARAGRRRRAAGLLRRRQARRRRHDGAGRRRGRGGAGRLSRRPRWRPTTSSARTRRRPRSTSCSSIITVLLGVRDHHRRARHLDHARPRPCSSGPGRSA